jgi:hypothetical protein
MRIVLVADSSTGSLRMTSAEHYGSLMNLDFDALAEIGMKSILSLHLGA